ncbi:MAG: hypothetical protein VX644_00055 [Planctomycetota bacterium]|nr:hypothetical protein [Planctomycetota bacterium]
MKTRGWRNRVGKCRFVLSLSSMLFWSSLVLAQQPRPRDPLESLLKQVRQQQEVEFAKPLANFAATPQGAQAIERYAKAGYPASKELAIYSLDWEPTLAAARVRARREQRPIFFIMVTNFSGPTNFYSGHC